MDRDLLKELSDLRAMREAYRQRSYIPELAERMGEGMLDNIIKKARTEPTRKSLIGLHILIQKLLGRRR